MLKRVLICCVALSIIFCACSSSDDDKNVVLSGNEDKTELKRQKEISVELLSVDSCIARFDSKNPTMGVDSFVIKPADEDCYTIRVLGNTQCPPAEKPDNLEFSVEGDTLYLNIDKKNRYTDVSCTCMYWADVMVKGSIYFDKVKINGNVFSVSIE